MTAFLKNTYQLIALITIIVTFSSCSGEADIKIEDPDVKASFDTTLSEVLEIMDDNPQLAINQLSEVINQADAIESKYYSGKAKWYLAYIYDGILEDVSLAYAYYNEALKDIMQTDDSSLKMSVYNNLGILYRFYGQHDAAISNYDAALNLKEDLTSIQLADLYYNYGIALKLKGDSSSFFRAEEMFTRSLEYSKKIDYSENIADINNQIGSMYLALGNFEMARLAYNNTIKTFVTNLDLQGHVGEAYHGIGLTYSEENNNEAAIRAFHKALDYKKRSGSIFVTKYDLGTVLKKSGELDKAIAVWKEALNEKHNKNSIEQVKIYADLTTALASNNQYEDAIAYSSVYTSSVQNILSEGETYKSENDKVLFANIIKEYEEFNRPVPFYSRPIVIISILLGSAAIIYILVVLYYRSKSKRKVSQAMDEIQSEFMHLKVD